VKIIRFIERRLRGVTSLRRASAGRSKRFCGIASFAWPPKGEPVEQHPGVGAAISPRGRAKMEINLRYDNAT